MHVHFSFICILDKLKYRGGYGVIWGKDIVVNFLCFGKKIKIKIQTLLGKSVLDQLDPVNP